MSRLAELVENGHGPILTGATARLVGGSVALGGLIVSGVAYVAAMTGLYRLVSRDFEATTARRTAPVESVRRWRSASVASRSCTGMAGPATARH